MSQLTLGALLGKDSTPSAAPNDGGRNSLDEGHLHAYACRAAQGPVWDLRTFLITELWRNLAGAKQQHLTVHGSKQQQQQQQQGCQEQFAHVQLVGDSD